MSISLYLGRFFGLYLLITGVALLVRSQSLRSVIHEFERNPALIVVSGVFTMMFGLLFVLAHNVWELNWRLLITILAYLTLIKGILRLYFPHWSKKHLKKLNNLQSFRVIGLIAIILGIYLTVVTFSN